MKKALFFALVMTVTKIIEINADGSVTMAFKVEKDGHSITMTEAEAKELGRQLPGQDRGATSNGGTFVYPTRLNPV